MKRCISIIVSLLLTLTMLSGAAGAADSPDKIQVVCTIFPQYDWVRQILGETAENVELTLLLDNAVDLHSFQPSVEDIIRISTCDLFIYVGGESDDWVPDALENATNPDMVVINLLDALGGAAKPEELVEGMEPEDHDHGHEEEHEGEEHAEEEHDHAEEEALDEHVWLSLRNAQVFCAAIAEALSSLDAGNADVYQNNVTAYNAELAALDAEYEAAMAALPEGGNTTLLFGDRFPFRYLVDDYGIGYYAAFVGCSAETEASFETIIFLARKTEELGLKNIIVTESADGSIAETIRDNTTAGNQEILVMNALQSVSPEDIENGASYIDIMRRNLEILRKALA